MDLGGRNIGLWLFVLIALLMQSCKPDAPKNEEELCRRVTYTADVAPILQKHCTGCHNPGGVAPFSLSTYQEAAQRVGGIVYATKSGYMPPWRADIHYSSFVGEQSISEDEIDLLERWRNDGTPFGDDTTQPTTVAMPVDTTPNRQPFMVLHPNKDTTIQDGGDEYFVNYLFTNVSDHDLLVNTFNFVPGNFKVTHHAWIFIDTSGQLRDRAKNGDYFSIEKNEFHFPYTKPMQQDFLLFTPGNQLHFLPDSICYRIPAHADIVVQVHYASHGRPFNTGRFSLELYPVVDKLSQHDIEKLLLLEDDIQNQPFIIPRNSTKQFVLMNKSPDKDIDVYRISPHMHYRGKSFIAFAVSPQGDTIPLIRIPKWDFRWQGLYTYKKPVTVPANSTIWAYAVFDNTNNNPQNPVVPAQEVKYGFRSIDEMLELMLEYIPKQ